MRQKSSLYKTLIIFIGILLVITFFSRSIYQYNLPAVTLAFAEEGVIRHRARVAGSIEATEHTDIIAPESGKITLHINEGEAFEKGQLLYTIELDTESLKDRLKALENNKALALVQIDKLKNDIIYYQNKNILDASIESIDLSSYENEIEDIQAKIQAAETAKEQLLILYNAGAIPKAELDEKEREITELQSQLNIIRLNKQRAIDKRNDEIIKKDKSLEQAQKDHQKAITDLEYQLQSEQLSLTHIENEIGEINTQLETGGIYEYHALTGGEIASAYEAAKDGRYITRNASVFSVHPEGRVYYAVFTLSNDVDYIEIESKCDLYIKSKNARNIEGTVKNIKYNSENYEIQVAFEYPDIRGGERVEAVFEKVSEPYLKTLPNSAIREDDISNYVLMIERKKTAYGYDYIAIPRYVNVQEEGPAYSAVNDNFPADEAVIIGSNQTIMEGSKVRIIK